MAVLRRFFDDFGRFSDENGLGGILREDLGSVPLDSATTGGLLDAEEAVEFFRPSRFDRKAVARLAVPVLWFPVASESVRAPEASLSLLP